MTRLDWIAVGPRGVYALMDAGLASKAEVAAFKGHATRQGHRTELVTVAEACRRHEEYLQRCARDRSTAADAEMAALAGLPSPAQLDLFGAQP